MPVDPSLMPVTNKVDESGLLITDIACRRCGYNLRGLREDGRCPECGTPVGLSTRGDLLQFADPAWVEKVARGLRIILWMILVGIAAHIATFLTLSFVTPAATVPVSLVTAIGAFYGVWLMTEPDPSGIGEDPNVTARKVVRLTLILGLVGQFVALIVETFPIPEVPGIAFGGFALLLSIAGLIGEFAKFMYYERLALRIPEEALAYKARFLRWAYTITLGITVVGGAAIAFLPSASSGKPGAPPGLACLILPLGIAYLLFSIMTLLLLFKLRRAIAEEARLARATWTIASEGPPKTPSGEANPR